MSDEMSANAADDRQNATPAPGSAEGMVQLALKNPSNIPDKFRGADGTVDVDALTESYRALERRMSGAPDPEPEPDPEPKGPAPKQEPETPSGSFEEALSDPEPATLQETWAQAEREMQAGGLTDATKAELTKAGVPESMITMAQQAVATKRQQDMAKATEIVGGKENLDRVFGWAKQNLSADQRQALARDLQGPNGEMVLRGLADRARSAGALGEQGSLQDPETGPPVASNRKVVPFRDMAEMQAAMADPRYNTDPDYRMEVAKRIGAARGIDPSNYDKVGYV